MVEQLSRLFEQRLERMAQCYSACVECTSMSLVVWFSGPAPAKKAANEGLGMWLISRSLAWSTSVKETVVWLGSKFPTQHVRGPELNPKQ